MNLADAIRQASQHPTAATTTATTMPEPESVLIPDLKEVELVNEQPTPAPENVMPTNTVRLELVLSPEQLSNLLRAIVANQHSVMTLREAASYLRLPGSALDQLASEGKIPALSIDGKWRFTHAALDEWMNRQKPEETAFDKAVGA
jgi:excisionase family DNA binding protein